MNYKLSAFYIMTEPEKMGYPYLESIISTLSFVDEVVVVMGREEESSETKIRCLRESLPSHKQIKIIKTNSWPAENWDYDVMKEHIQRGFDECTHNLCMKIDCDYVFRDQHADEIRHVIITALTDYPLSDTPGRSDNHMLTVGRINFACHGKATYHPAIDHTPCYVINKAALKNDGVSCYIDNKGGSNQPRFHPPDHPRLRIVRVGNALPGSIEQFLQLYHRVCPVNYSYTFMDQTQVAKTWAAWHKAVEIKFGAQRSCTFDVTDVGASLKNFIDYHYVHGKIPLIYQVREDELVRDRVHALGEEKCRRMGLLRTNKAGAPVVGSGMFFTMDQHPTCMQEKIRNMPSKMWGYDNFGFKEPQSLTGAGSVWVDVASGTGCVSKEYEKWRDDVVKHSIKEK